jgi:hypothetical protein
VDWNKSIAMHATVLSIILEEFSRPLVWRQFVSTWILYICIHHVFFGIRMVHAQENSYASENGNVFSIVPSFSPFLDTLGIDDGVSTLLRDGLISTDGQLPAPRFWQPQKLQFMPSDPNYVLLVADTQNSAIRVMDFTNRRVHTLALGTYESSIQSAHLGNFCYNTSMQKCGSNLQSTDALRMPYAFSIHPWQQYIVVADTRNRALRIMDFFTDEWTLVTTDLYYDVIDVVWISHGTLVVLMADNSMHSLDASQLPFSSDTNHSLSDIGMDTGDFEQILSIVFNPSSHVLYMADFLARTIFEVQLDSSEHKYLGKQVVVGNADNFPVAMMMDSLPHDTASSALEALLGGPTQLCFDDDAQRLYFTDRSFIWHGVDGTMVNVLGGSAVRYWDLALNKVFTLAGHHEQRDPIAAVWGIALKTSHESAWLVFGESDTNSIKAVSTSPWSQFPCAVGFQYNVLQGICTPCDSINPKPSHVIYIGSENGCQWTCSEYPLQQPFACHGHFISESNFKPPESRWALKEIEGPSAGTQNTTMLIYVCNAGYYKNNEQCLLCEENAFCDGLDYEQVGLQNCPYNPDGSGSSQIISISPKGSTSKENCSCIAGYFFNASIQKCSLCPRGAFFCVNNTLVECPVHTHTLTDGSASIYDCICVAGYVGPNGGPCAKCPPVQMCFGGNATSGCSMNTRLHPLDNNPFTDATQCKPLAGFFQETEGSQGLECLPGYYCSGVENLPMNSSVQDYLSPCPAYSNSSKGASMLSDCKCMDGMYLSSSQKECILCPQGTYCTHGRKEICPFNLTTMSSGMYVHVTDMYGMMYIYGMTDMYGMMYIYGMMYMPRDCMFSAHKFNPCPMNMSRRATFHHMFVPPHGNALCHLLKILISDANLAAFLQTYPCPWSLHIPAVFHAAHACPSIP